MMNRLTNCMSTLAIHLALLFLIAAPAMAQERPSGKPSATISIHELQVAFVGSGAIGGGTLNFEGKHYPISVKGLGVGGIGASELSASGLSMALRAEPIWPALMPRFGRDGRWEIRARARYGSRTTGASP